jgi:dATP pyrophosphohydrolase
MYKIPESVLVIIYTRDLQVLLMERVDKLSYWQSVTGSRDSLNEPLVMTAIRELQEETGIVLSKGVGAVPLSNLYDWNITNTYDIYPLWRSRYKPGVKKNIEHVFGLLVPNNTTIKLSPKEHSQYRWLPYKEAAKLCFSISNAEAILKLPNYLT